MHAAIDKTDNAGTLHAVALRLAGAGADEMDRIAVGLEKYGARKDAAIARADARMNQIPDDAERTNGQA